MTPKTPSKSKKQEQTEPPELLEEIRLARVILTNWGSTDQDITPQGIRAILGALDTLIEAAYVHNKLGDR